MYSIGMRYKMKCLYRDGVELTREQLAAEPSYEGDLLIEDWGSSENVFKHDIRKARFLDPQSAHGREMLSPLFDPVVVKMTSEHMLIRGYQIRRIEQEAVQTAQCWLLKQEGRLPESS